MSIGVPCLWVPWLSSPAPPSLAITSHLSTVARHGEQVSSTPWTVSPLLTLPGERETTISLRESSSAEMQRAGAKAENALTTPVPVSAPGSGLASDPYRGRDILSDDVASPMPRAAREDLLTRAKLEFLVRSQTSLSMSQLHIGPCRTGETTSAPQPSLDANEEHEHDRDSPIGPADRKGETIGSDMPHISPSLEKKKKLKRFRLTHNQTRFLISEFTRQAHPDAPHRKRLSREIPGLTPHQVQVWFQNRRAKLKRLMPNDRERMLKSRALPDDFDTTKVLRTPFDNKSTRQLPVALPQGYGVPSQSFAEWRALRTDRFQRPHPADYVVSPLSSASTTPICPMDHCVPRHPGGIMAAPYHQHQLFKGSVSPTDSQGPPITYDMSNIGSQPQSNRLQSHHAMEPQIPPHRRTLSALQSLLVSAPHEYQQYSYASPSGSMAGLPYTQSNASTLSLPTSFAPSES